jgi:hypothetical protein
MNTIKQNLFSGIEPFWIVVFGKPEYKHAQMHFLPLMGYMSSFHSLAQWLEYILVALLVTFMTM